MIIAVLAAVAGAQSCQREASATAASFPTVDHPNQMFWKSQSACRLMRHDQAGFRL